MGGWKRRFLPPRSIRPQHHHPDHHSIHHHLQHHAHRGDSDKFTSASDSWRATLKSWEEEFCYMVGVPWKKLCGAKKLLPFYKKIFQWDDSAAHEAFNNAKGRFWAQINGLHYDMSSPDPDEYIDEIDWYAKIDPELLLNLEPSYPLPDDMDGKPSCHRSSWDSYFSENTWVPCMGWGSIEDPGTSTGWGCLDKRNDNCFNRWNSTNGWGNVALEDYSWGNRDNSWGQWEQNKDKTWEQWKNWKKDADLNYHSETMIKCGKKREGDDYDWYGSRSKEHKSGTSHPANNSRRRYHTGRKANPCE